MKATKIERTRLLHEKLDKYKDDILKDKAEGKSNNELAKKYGINAYTLGDYLYFWENGIKRKRLYKRGIKLGKMEKRKFSPELRKQMRINTVFNDKLIRYAKDD